MFVPALLEVKLGGAWYLAGDRVPSEEEEEETDGDLVKEGAWVGPGGSV